MNGISEGLLDTLRDSFHEDEYKASMSALAQNEMADSVFLSSEASRLNGAFSIEIKTHGISDQMKSGRCWMFSAMNILREKVIANCNTDDFYLSGNYLGFYDKLEKCNNYLEMIIQYADRSVTDRINSFILEGIWDGNFFDGIRDLVKKYGVVPYDVMPETYQSCHTESILKVLNSLLHKDAVLLRKAIKDGRDVQPMKEDMMKEIYRVECIAFGKPVERFDFCYRDLNGEYHCDADMTPKEFYDRYVGLDLDEYVYITCEPSLSKPMHEPWSCHYIGCMADHDFVCLNLQQEELEELCLKQLKDGEPVWFGCDSRAYGDRKHGVWDIDSFSYQQMFGVDLMMEKGDRLSFLESYPSHNMILAGVNLDGDEKPDRWKIENSWGKEAGKDGYFVMSEKYFKEYVYETAILKKYFSEEQLSLLEKKPVKVEPWFMRY